MYSKENCDIYSGEDSQSYDYKGCEDIKPNKASDCVLSEEDKSIGYSYCCYLDDDDGDKECFAETKDSYQVAKLLLGNHFDCGNSSSGYLSLPRLSIIYLLLIILIL